MKYIKNIILSSLVVLGVSSCNDDDTEYIYSVKPQVTIDNVSASTVTEGDSFTVTLNTNTPYKETLDFKLEIVSGGDMSDFNIGDPSEPDAPTTIEDGLGVDGYLIQIPAYATSYTFSVNPVIDLEVEGTDKYVFKLRSTRNGNGSLVGNDTFSVDVENYTNTTLGVELAWSKDQNYQYLKLNHEDTDPTTGAPISYPDDDEIINDHGDLCGIVDLDVILSGVGYLAGTADCPEVALETYTLPDGVWGIDVDLYEINFGFDPDESLVGSFAIPFQITIGKTGVFKTVIDYSDVLYTYSPIGSVTVATIEVVGGKYTVKDIDGNIVAQEQ
ncbi:hypothetical protein [Corallibacter sp.]|uniref:hypothetical protein n=1 Tax=Corallibacter sp. TaxID=2038084 RepID=UPI003AB477E9